MPRHFIKLNGMYGEWSTIVDSPVTHGMTLEEFKEYCQLEYGKQGTQLFEQRIRRADKNGTSCIGYTLDELILCGEMTKDEIVKAYDFCPQEDGSDG